ncbi:hypothetical protein ACFY1L_28165 [Streptomyces sp. NPDC001663]|uniref:hypothetical protein n=1 Tax=Streptomyces sp. NPDC001663 TaxID=3364597 RepID=UPI00367D6659
MRFTIDVREGDWTVGYGPYGWGHWSALTERLRTGEFAAGANGGLQRWADLDRSMHERSFEFSAPVDLLVADFTAHALTEARRLGLARPEPGTRATSDPLESRADTVLSVQLIDPVTGECLPERSRLDETGLADGDLLELRIEHPAEASYEMAPIPNTAELIRLLQLTENADAPDGGPRLWGILLYTDADAELAAYVRTHFDDLNALSGPSTRVFVIERRVDSRASKRYWREHLEPELYRALSVMRWLQWAPYEPQGAYKIASALGLGPELLPCLVFFHARYGPSQEGEKIVFRIEDTSTAYFRALFGGIQQALRVDSGVPDESGGADWDRLHAQWEYRDYQGSEPPRSPATVLRSLVSPARAADAAAFDRVRKAEDAIKAALVPARGPEQQGIVINNSRVVVMSGAKVSENFYFQGTNTTFINRPKDTVVRDFQNTYGSATGAADLTQLLELVLSSRDLNDTQREEAAGAVHDLARAAAQPEPDVPAVRGRIERLRALMTGAGADIAQSAMAILASLLGLFSG